MRFIVLSLFAAGALGALAVACSSSNPPAEGSSSSSSGSVGDAAPAGDSSVRTDGGSEAGSSDASSDGGADGAPDKDGGPGDATTAPGPLTVTVSTGKSGPVAGASVVFHDTDGSEQTIVTDANGTATRELVHAGATVTVALTTAAGRSLTTIANVEPSETIFVGSPIQSFVSIPYTVNVAAFAGASSYLLDWGCSVRLFPTAGTPATGYITSKCLGPNGELDVLFTARGADGTPMAYAYKALTPNGNVDLTVSAGDWDPAGGASTLTVANAPAAATSVSGSIAFASGTATYALDATNLPLSFIRPPDTFTANLLRGGELYLGGSSFSGRFELQAIGTGNLTEDASSYLPAISAPQVTGTGAAPSLAWTSGGSLASASFIAQLSSAEADATPVTWTLVFPGQAATSFAPPALPAGLADYVPTDPWAVTSVLAFESAEISYRDLHRSSSAYQTGVRNRDLTKLGTKPFSVKYTETGP